MESPARLLPAAPGTIRMSPASVASALDGMLRRRGIRRVYSAACAVFGVVSVDTDLTVWTNGRVLLWHFRGVPDACPAAEVEIAAERLATLAAQRRSSDPGQS
jgi:hypothetical protein